MNAKTVIQSMSYEKLYLQLRLLKVTLTCFSLGLFLITWQLWVPQTLFPQVPLFSYILNLPTWIDWLTLITMVISSLCLLGMVFASWFLRRQDQEYWQSAQQVCGGLFFFAFLISIAFDQHRLQPWAYQFAIGFLLLTCLKPPRAVRLFRLFVISIYFYSALSKCDASFIQTLGPQLVKGLFTGIGVSTEYWTERSLTLIAGSFPVAEFLIAVGLLIHCTRKWALWVAISMHACLILAVGPWGLNHHGGVLVWNIYFILQDLILFSGLLSLRHSGEAVPSQADFSLSFKHSTGREKGIMAIVWFVMLAPLLEPIGYFDHWPAWGLYASSHDRVTLLVDEEAKSQLPPALQPFVDPPRPFSPWCRVRVDRWSLAELGAPVYPQARFQLGVAIAISKIPEQNSGHGSQQPQVRLLFESAAQRLTGKRKISEYTGLTKIEPLAQQFWFNAIPRPFDDIEND